MRGGGTGGEGRGDVMGPVGVEPTRPLSGRRILSPLRLPFRHGPVCSSTSSSISSNSSDALLLERLRPAWGGLLQIGVVTGVAGLRRFGRRQTLSVPAVAGSAGGEVAAAEGGVRWTCVPVCLRSLITMISDSAGAGESRAASRSRDVHWLAHRRCCGRRPRCRGRHLVPSLAFGRPSLSPPPRPSPRLHADAGVCVSPSLHRSYIPLKGRGAEVPRERTSGKGGVEDRSVRMSSGQAGATCGYARWSRCNGTAGASCTVASSPPFAHCAATSLPRSTFAGPAHAITGAVARPFETTPWS